MNRAIRVSLIEKVAFEQRQKGGERMSRVDNCGKNILRRGNGH